jgi:hypothetical protein
MRQRVSYRETISIRILLGFFKINREIQEPRRTVSVICDLVIAELSRRFSRHRFQDWKGVGIGRRDPVDEGVRIHAVVDQEYMREEWLQLQFYYEVCELCLGVFHVRKFETPLCSSLIKHMASLFKSPNAAIDSLSKMRKIPRNILRHVDTYDSSRAHEMASRIVRGFLLRKRLTAQSRTQNWKEIGLLSSTLYSPKGLTDYVIFSSLDCLHIL